MPPRPSRFWSPAGIPGSVWRLGWDGPSPGASQAGTRLSRAAVGHLGFTGCSLWVDPQRDLTIVLLAGAGLMIRSFMKLYSMEIGVDTSHMLTMRLALPDKKYPTPEKRRLFYESLLPRLAGIPGVAASSITGAPPGSGAGASGIEFEGRTEADAKKGPEATTLYVSEGYFDTLGVAALQGRLLREIDGAPGSEAVVVNARFASKYYPGENVLGKRIRLKAPTSGPDAQKVKPWTTIVGVTPIVRQRNVKDVEPDAVIYLSYRLDPPSGTAILIRGQGEPGALTSAVRAAASAP